VCCDHLAMLSMGLYWHCSDCGSVGEQHFEGYDPEGFSVWLCEYKYPEENTVNYVTMNKVRTHSRHPLH
jgi:hypothetical protein